MKTTKKQFEMFKKEFKKYQNLFELNNWRIDFVHEKLNGSRADITPNSNGYTATVRLTSDWDNEDKENINKKIIKSAQHEACHLLLSRITGVGRARYIAFDEMTKADEETTRKIQNVLEKLNA